MTEFEHAPAKQIFNLGEGEGGGCGPFGGNNFITILLLFFLFGGGFGGGWGRGGMPMPIPVGNDQCQTCAQLQSDSAVAAAKNGTALDFLLQANTAQLDKLNTISNNQAVNTAALQAAFNNGINGLNSNVTNGFYGLNTTMLNSKFDTVSAIQNCCCNTQRGIADLGAAMDRNTCAIISSGKDNTTAILNALCNHWQEVAQVKIADLQRQLSEANILAAIKNA